MRYAGFLLFLVTGCISTGSNRPVRDGGADDLSAAGDLAELTSDLAATSSDLAGADLATTSIDLATPAADFAVVPDLSRPPDFALPADLAVRPDFATPLDLSVPPDFSTPPDLAGAPDFRLPLDYSLSDFAVGCSPIVNEIMTGTTSGANDEFLELYNPCGVGIDMSGWKIGYRSANNLQPVTSPDSVTLFTFQTGYFLPAGAYFVLGGSGYSGVSDAMLGNGLAAIGGSVGIRNQFGVLTDSVGWGSVLSGNALTEGSPAPAPAAVAPPGQSIGRIPNGTDSQNNAVDFFTSGSTPKAPNN